MLFFLSFFWKIYLVFVIISIYKGGFVNDKRNRFKIMLLVYKNSIFYLYQFKLDFLEKDVFRLTYSLILVKNPDIDYIFGNVIEYKDKKIVREELTKNNNVFKKIKDRK